MTKEAATTEMLQLLEDMYFEMRSLIQSNSSGLIETEIIENPEDKEDTTTSFSIRGLSEEGYAPRKIFFGFLPTDD